MDTQALKLANAYNGIRDAVNDTKDKVLMTLPIPELSALMIGEKDIEEEFRSCKAKLRKDIEAYYLEINKIIDKKIEKL